MVSAFCQKSCAKNVCVICGVAEATTKDHIPPKGMFLRPRTNDLITVPACKTCNESTAANDEAFRVYLSLRIGTDDNAARKLWVNEALPTLQHNTRLAQSIRNSLREISIFTPAGIFVQSRTGGHWPASAHDPIIEKKVRGLYYHHFGEILAAKVQIKVYWHHQLNDNLKQLCKELTINGRIADGAFEYRTGRAIDAPLGSVWIFSFYGRHFASGCTLPIVFESSAENAVSVRANINPPSE